MRVQFADTAQMLIFEHSEYSNGNSVAREELWYTPAEYARMTLAVKESVLEVWRKQRQRQRAMTDVPGSDSAGIGDENEESLSPAQVETEAELQSILSDCVGIEHLLTRASMLEVRACRARCVDGVLEEQARQMADQSLSTLSRFRWDAIALSSLAQTRRTTLRARRLGKLHEAEA